MIFINMSKNIFEKIRDGEEPSEIVYKDKYVTAFRNSDKVFRSYPSDGFKW